MRFSLKETMLLMVLFAVVMAFGSLALNRPIEQKIKGIAFSPNGQLIAVQGTENTRVFMTANGKQIRRFGVTPSVQREFLKFVDDQHLMVYGRDSDRRRGIFWFNISTGKQLREILFSDPDLSQSFTPSHDGLIVFDNGSQLVSYYSNSASTSGPVSTSPMVNFLTKYDPSLTSWIKDSQPFYNGSRDDILIPISANPKSNPRFETMQVEWPDGTGDKAEIQWMASKALALPDNEHFLLPIYETLNLYRWKNGDLVWSIPIETILGIELSPNGSHALVLSGEQFKDPQLAVVETKTGKSKLQRVIESRQSPMAVSHQGIVALVSDESNLVELWDAADGQRLWTIDKPGLLTLLPRYPHLYAFLKTILILAWSILWVRVRTGASDSEPKVIFLDMLVFPLVAGIALTYLASLSLVAQFQEIQTTGQFKQQYFLTWLFLGLGIYLLVYFSTHAPWLGGRRWESRSTDSEASSVSTQ